METIPSNLFFIQSLIDEISEPAFVYLRAEDKIFAANPSFQGLSRYSLSELKGLRLSAIMPELPDTNPTAGDARPALFQTSSGEMLFVLMKVLSLAPTNQIVLIVLTPQTEENLIRQDLLDQEFRYDNLKLLTGFSQQKSVLSAYQYGVEVIDKVMGPEVLLVYQRRNGEFTSLFPPEENPQFPATLPAEEFAGLSVTALWREGKPTHNTLEEAANAANLAYLILLPIVVDDAMDGLFLLADSGKTPDNEDLRYLNLLANHCANAIRSLSAIDHARQTLRKVRLIAAIQQRITENLEEGIIILTPDLCITEMNPAAETMLGYASPEVFQQKAEMVLIGNETLSTMYKSAQQGIPLIVGNDLNLNNRYGERFPAQILCLPVLENKTVKSIVLILRDLSQSEKIRERTQQLEQRAFLGEFSAIFAHEVRNPIYSISAGLQLIGLSMSDDAPYADLVSRMQVDCQRLNHLVKSTLSFSKPIEYQLQPVDLRDMLPLLLDRWAPRMARLNITYSFSAPEDALPVKADPRAIEQVFINLISNAIQAMEEKGGTLNVRMSAADPQTVPPQCEIIIADSGPGIPEDVIEHIFEPFLTTKASGTGLGLAITKRIVTAHEGSMFVESFPGGSVFHVLLPFWN